MAMMPLESTDENRGQPIPLSMSRSVISDSVRGAVLDRDGGACSVCGATDDLAIDHIVPWSRGGGDDIDNLQILCRDDNTRKFDHLPLAWIGTLESSGSVPHEVIARLTERAVKAMHAHIVEFPTRAAITSPRLPSFNAVAESNLSETIASAVRAERARLKVTQDQLAVRLGWSKTTLWELESGRRRVCADDLPVLCEALGVPLAELLRRASLEDLHRMGI